MPALRNPQIQNGTARTVGVLYLLTMATAIAASAIRMTLPEPANPPGTLITLGLWLALKGVRLG